MLKKKLPTCFQAQTLRLFIEGWELIIGESFDKKERIYWKKSKKSSFGDSWYNDTMECERVNSKRLFMSYMERHGWVTKEDTGWKITNDGIEAKQRYDDFYSSE